MPDISQYTSEIIAFLAGAGPYLKDAAQEFAKGAGKQTGTDLAKQAGLLLVALRGWFQKDQNQKAEKVLDLVEDDPTDEDQLNALGKQIQATLEKHPDWAADVQQILGRAPVQEIIAKNKSQVEDITMDSAGSGTQRIDADDSSVVNVRMTNRGH